MKRELLQSLAHDGLNTVVEGCGFARAARCATESCGIAFGGSKQAAPIDLRIDGVPTNERSAGSTQPPAVAEKRQIGAGFASREASLLTDRRARELPKFTTRRRMFAHSTGEVRETPEQEAA